MSRQLKQESNTHFKQNLVSASDQLSLHRERCAANGRPFPATLRQAHDSIRAEIKRLEEVDEQPI